MNEQEYQHQRDGLTHMLEQLHAERVEAQRAWSQARWGNPDPVAEQAAQARLADLHDRISEATAFAHQIDAEFRPRPPWWRRFLGLPGAR